MSADQEYAKLIAWMWELPDDHVVMRMFGDYCGGGNNRGFRMVRRASTPNTSSTRSTADYLSTVKMLCQHPTTYLGSIGNAGTQGPLAALPA